MRSRSLVPVFAFALTGVIVSCEDSITNITEGFDDVATWRADLNGANERPNPVNTPATGRAWFIDNGTSITYHIEFSGLLQPKSNAHIHRGAGDVAGGVMVQLPVLAGQRSGIVSGTINMTVADISSEAGTQSPEDLRALLNSGGTYVNIHSSSGTTPETGFPAGEIRGQITRR